MNEARGNILSFTCVHYQMSWYLEGSESETKSLRQQVPSHVTETWVCVYVYIKLLCMHVLLSLLWKEQKYGRWGMCWCVVQLFNFLNKRTSYLPNAAGQKPSAFLFTWSYVYIYMYTYNYIYMNIEVHPSFWDTPIHIILSALYTSIMFHWYSCYSVVSCCILFCHHAMVVLYHRNLGAFITYHTLFPYNMLALSHYPSNPNCPGWCVLCDNKFIIVGNLYPHSTPDTVNQIFHQTSSKTPANYIIN